MPKKRRLYTTKPRRRRSKSPQSGDDVVSARDRFKGALQDLLPHSEEESDTSDDNEHWSSSTKSNKRVTSGGISGSGGIKKLANDSGHEPSGFRQAFKMKLFDRTVDMSNYTDSTPLYPICRAWIQNQSHSTFSHSKSTSDDLKYKDDPDSFSVRNLPPPAYRVDGTEKIRVPKPIPRQTQFPSLVYNEGEAPSQEALLKDNLTHWVKVRQSWMDASRDNEARYQASIDILTNMFYNSQK